MTCYAKPGKRTLSKGVKLLNPAKGTNKRNKFNLMFNPLIPCVLYSVLLSCHSLVCFSGVFFVIFHVVLCQLTSVYFNGPLFIVILEVFFLIV